MVEENLGLSSSLRDRKDQELSVLSKDSHVLTAQGQLESELCTLESCRSAPLISIAVISSLLQIWILDASE